MQPSHDWFTGHLAFESVATARSRADAHRLRVAAGVDGRSRTVRVLGSVVDRLQAADHRRRTRADHGPRSIVDDTVHAVRPA